MVKIRLTRTGRAHDAHFRIIVADSRRARDGKFIEIIGRYHPTQKADAQLFLDNERALYWLRCGAQPTDTVRSLLRRKGVMKEYHETKVAERKAREAAKNEAAGA